MKRPNKCQRMLGKNISHGKGHASRCAHNRSHEFGLRVRLGFKVGLGLKLGFENLKS